MMEYLECECTYFPSMKDDDPIMSAYSYAKRDSEHEGFVPVMIKADDETLWECLVMNSDLEHDADCYEFDPNTVTEYRKKMLASPIKDGKTVLEELTGQRKEEAEDDDMKKPRMTIWTGMRKSWARWRAAMIMTVSPATGILTPA